MDRRIWIVSPVYQDFPSFLKLKEEIAIHLERSGWCFREHIHVAIDDTGGNDPQIASLVGEPKPFPSTVFILA